MPTADQDIVELVARYSRAVDSFIVAADRTRYESELFDMRRRTLIGQYCLADHLVWFLRAATKGISIPEFAASRKRFIALPSTQLIHAMPWSYLVPRQNEIAIGRRAPGDDAQALSWLMDFWRAMSTSYYQREDGALLPSEMGDSQCVLNATELDAAWTMLDEVERDVDTVQRIAARLEMLNFVISGEIRGRNFCHGPYQAASGDGRIVIQEFTELDRRHQPWTDGLLGYPLDNVVCIREVDPAEYVFDLYGFMFDKGGNFRHRIRRSALATVQDGRLRPIEDAELTELTNLIRASIRGAYQQFATWDEDFKIVYGIYHYLGEAAPYAEATGREYLVAELKQRMEASASERLEDIRAMDDVAPVWQHWRSGGGFSPPV